MIKCKRCNRITEKGEPTAKFLTLTYNNPQNKSKGKRIYSEETVCFNCKGVRVI